MMSALSEKIIAHACGRENVRPGEIITGQIDLLMMHDSGGPRRVASRLERLGAKVWDPDKVVVVSDHFVPAVDIQSAEILSLTRKWAKQQGVRHYDMLGICHVVLQEYGHIQPGMFCVGGDSHSPSGGAFGAFMVGMGATDITGALVTGEVWLRVPQTTRIELDEALPHGVSAKDVMLMLCSTLGMGNEGQVFEFTGDGVRAMPMHERLTLCNMTAELGGVTGIVAPDATTIDALEAAGRPVDVDIGAWQSDADASFAATHRYAASALVPHVAAPHSPGNSRPVTEYEPIHVDQCYIGACTGAKLTDLRMAAEILKGRKVASNTRLMVAPASVAMTEQAAAEGILAALTEAGAIMLPTGCGACAGLGAGMLAADEVEISTTARNFKGRMGSPESSVYLGSPYSVAAAAVKGAICDPRELLGDNP